MVKETMDGAKKILFEKYLLMFQDAVLTQSSKVSFDNDIHGYVYHSFVERVEEFNKNVSNSHGVPVNLNRIPDRASFMKVKKSTIKMYVNACMIVSIKDWTHQMSLTKFICEPLAVNILRLGFVHNPPKKYQN